MSTDHHPPEDHGWDNRRLILASLAPRTATRPARKPPATDATDDDNAGAKKTPLLSRALRASGRGLTAAGRAAAKRVPAEHRTRILILTVTVVLIGIAALAGLKHLTADITPPPAVTTAAPPPPPSQAPLKRDDILSGVTATDVCPRDANYSEASRAFDSDFNTAWICTRAKNQDGQTMQVNFGRQVTLTQIRAVGGFDALAPDGTDQWSQHRIVTKLEIWFPKDLKRDPVTIDTGGVRGWRFTTLNPPATVSQLLIRVAETSDAPQANSPTRDTTTAAPDDETTVAISEIQFIGTGAPRAT